MAQFSINMKNLDYPLETTNAVPAGCFTFLNMYVGMNVDYHMTMVDPINHKDTIVDQDNGYLRFRINPNHHAHLFYNQIVEGFFNGMFEMAVKYIYDLTGNPVYIHVLRKKKRLVGIIKDALKNVDPKAYQIITHCERAIITFKYSSYDKKYSYNNLFRGDSMLDFGFDLEDIHIFFRCRKREE